MMYFDFPRTDSLAVRYVTLARFCSLTGYEYPSVQNLERQGALAGFIQRRGRPGQDRGIVLVDLLGYHHWVWNTTVFDTPATEVGAPVAGLRVVRYELFLQLSGLADHVVRGLRDSGAWPEDTVVLSRKTHPNSGRSLLLVDLENYERWVTQRSFVDANGRETLAAV
jgi:hypothetical protein